MKKEEILQKTKKTGLDEREQQIELKAISFGGIAVTVLVGVFIAINTFKSQSSRDLLAILLAFWSAQYFYKHLQLKSKMFLVLGCVSAVGFVAAIASYIIWG